MNTFLKILGPIGIIYFALAFIGGSYVVSPLMIVMLSYCLYDVIKSSKKMKDE